MARILIVVLVLIGAASVPIIADRPLPPADLSYFNGSDVNTIDPQRMSWTVDLRVARVLYEPLVQNDIYTYDQRAVPGVAERWEVSDDGKTYTFHFNPDAKWSNGSPVTADDFIFSWRRAMLPDLVSDYFKLFLVIDGAEEFYDWRADQLANYEAPDGGAAEKAAAAQAAWAEAQAKFDELVGMTAVDERTLVIRLKRPVPYFLDLCAFAVFSPVYPPLVSRYEQPDPDTARLNAQSGWTKPGVHISNGPFKLERWRFKRDIRMVRNEHYWGQHRVALDSIEILSIADPNATVLALDTGSIQWISDLTVDYRGDMLEAKAEFYEENAEEVARLRALGLDPMEIDRRLPDDPRKNAHSYPAFGTYFWNFNCLPELRNGQPNPFADPRVRRAFAMTVDKRAIADEIRRLGEPVARTMVPPGAIPGYESPTGVPCVSDAATPEEKDAIIAEARALLAEAGYPDPANDFPIVVEVLFNKDAGHDLIGQKLAKDWGRYLGVQTSLAQKELKVYRDDLKNANFITGRAGWYGDYADPTTFLDLFRKDDGNNDRKYDNPEFEALLDQALDETDPAARLALLAEAEAIMLSEQPVVPIFHYATVMAFDPDVITGVSSHPRNKNIAAWIDVKNDGKGPDHPRTYLTPETEARGARSPIETLDSGDELPTGSDLAEPVTTAEGDRP